MKRPVLFAIDFETCGTDDRRDYPHQLGLVVLVPDDDGRGYVVAERKKWRIRVPRRARWLRRRAYFGAMAVHGIPADVLHHVGEHPRDVCAEVATLFHHYNAVAGAARVMLAGQNVAFDAGFMRRLFALGPGRRACPFGYHAVDLTGLGVMLLGTAKFHETVAALGVKERKAHDALGDAEMLADALALIARGARYESPGTASP